MDEPASKPKLMVEIDQYDDMLDSYDKEFVDPLGNDLSAIKRDSKFES